MLNDKKAFSIKRLKKKVSFVPKLLPFYQSNVNIQANIPLAVKIIIKPKHYK